MGLKVKHRAVAEATFKTLEGSKAKVEGVKREEREVSPLPPFETGSMLQAATRRLRASTERVMRLAQDLFEGGVITYHRTDSTRVSDEGKRIAREYIASRFDPDDFVPRTWEPESEHVEGAHECIRPTRPLDADELARAVREGTFRTTLRITGDHLRLYDLIFRRFMASQMKPAVVEWQVAEIVFEVDGVKVAEVGLEGVVDIVKEGFTKVLTKYDLPAYGIRKVPELEEGDELDVLEVAVIERHDVYPYDQSELVQDMKKRGLGRPSTYAQIVEKLFRRGYVYEVPRRRWVVPTMLGRAVHGYLSSRYERFVSEETTRELEKRMDEVALDRTDYQSEVTNLYKELKKEVDMPLPDGDGEEG